MNKKILEKVYYLLIGFSVGIITGIFII